MKKHWKLIALMLVLSMLLSCMLTGCKQANPDATTGDDGQTTTGTRDTLNYGMPQEPGKLDPQNDSLLVAKMTNKQIYDTLFVVDDSMMEIKANLATEWNWVDDLTLDVTIRDDVVFHNGEKLTAHDVAYTLERCAVGNATATLFSSFDVENTVVTDDTHITIKMKQPYASALNVLANAISGIVCKSYAESVDETTFGREPIGTGAFKFVEWVSGDHITLTRNDAYWGHKPAYTTLNLRIINDNSARAIELETGGIDLTDSLTITTDIARFEEDPTIDVYKIPSTKVVYLAFNEQHPILGNETVRRAIAHAIDADSVRKAAYGDGAILATSSIPSTVYGYKNVGGYEYNVELAKQLLAEAGYADGFSFNTVCPSVAASVKTAEASTISASITIVDLRRKARRISEAVKVKKPESAPVLFIPRRPSAAALVALLPMSFVISAISFNVLDPRDSFRKELHIRIRVLPDRANVPAKLPDNNIKSAFVKRRDRADIDISFDQHTDQPCDRLFAVAVGYVYEQSAAVVHAERAVTERQQDSFRTFHSVVIRLARKNNLVFRAVGYAARGNLVGGSERRKASAGHNAELCVPT